MGYGRTTRTAAPPISMRHFIGSAHIKPVVRTAARLIGSWHIPMVLLIAAVCLIAGVTLPVVVVREFFLYRQELSVIDGVHALFDAGDWLLATVLALFSIVLPMVKILVLLVLWWRSREAQRPRGRLMKALEASGRWAMLDVFVVALVIVQMKANVFIDGHVAGAVYPFLTAVGLTAYAAQSVSGAQQQIST